MDEIGTLKVNSDLYVVLGARGGTGGAIVRELVGQGRRVRAVTRGGDAAAAFGPLLPASYEDCAADITDAGQLRRAVDGASVVFHCAQPAYTRWPQEFPAFTKGIVDATAAAGAKLVFADNLYMYEPGVSPLTEETPATSTTKKGGVRAAMAADLLAAHREGRLRVTVGRSSDYFGPGGLTSAMGERFFKALLAGKKVQWFVMLDQPHSLTYLPDMARAFVILADRAQADGGVWHIPSPPAVTGRQCIEAASRAAGVPARPAVLGAGSIRTLGLFMPVLREFPELLYQWDRPFVLDAGKFEAAFGPFAVTPLDEALARTVAWYRARV